jgi:CMP/dCMP kinase
MIISVTGMPGAGKSTISKMLAEKLSLKRYYHGQIIRDIAKTKKMTLLNYLKYLETHPEEEKEIDEYIKKLAREKNIIVESRTAFHFIPHSIKIFLDVDLHEGARRIFIEMKSHHHRNEEIYLSPEDAAKAQKERLNSDRMRYKKLYDFDMLDKTQYDIILDTTHLSTKEITEILIKEIEKQKHLKSIKNNTR